MAEDLKLCDLCKNYIAPDQCKEWNCKTVANLVRGYEAENTALRAEVERLKGRDESLCNKIVEQDGRERRYVEALEKILKTLDRKDAVGKQTVIKRIAKEALSTAPGSQALDRLHKEMIEDFLKAHSKEELDAMVKEAHVAVHGFRASDTIEVASDSQDHIPDAGEKVREKALKEAAEIVRNYGDENAVYYEARRHVIEKILALLKKDEGRVG